MSSLVRQVLKPSWVNASRTAISQCQNKTYQNNAQVSSPPLFTVMPLHTSAMMELQTTAVVERARQSTRIRKRKVYMDNKKKKEDRLRKNPPPIPYKVQLMMRAKGFGSKPIDWRQEDLKPFPVDDAWTEWFHSWKRLSVEEGLECLREHYHPTMLNNPNGVLWARIEISMAGAKQDRYIEPFSKMTPLYHPFERGVAEKSIMVFAKNEASIQEALDAGAHKAGGLDLVEDIAKGKVEIIDYDYFLAHDDIGNELKPILGILREKFPKKPNGTVGTNIEKLVRTFQNGQLVEVKKPKQTLGYKDDPSFGFCEVMIGRLDMPDEHIAVNLNILLETLLENAPAKKAGGFFTRIQFFMDGYLKNKFTVHHKLVKDKKYADHLKAQEISN